MAANYCLRFTKWLVLLLLEIQDFCKVEMALLGWRCELSGLKQRPGIGFFRLLFHESILPKNGFCFWYVLHGGDLQ